MYHIIIAFFLKLSNEVMSQKFKRKNFIHKNEAFDCEHCEKHNPKAAKSCRNHCKFCLYSKHVDEEVPGDRISECQNLMIPLRIESDGKKGYIIVHSCAGCQKQIVNKVADDDDLEKIIELMKIQNTQPLSTSHVRKNYR
jgi:hypothetical protein